MTITTESAITKTIAIDAPARAVFEALTIPEQFVAWWNDEPHHAVDSMSNDLRIGGAWRVEGHRENGERFWMHGEYTTIDRPHVLEFTWIYHWQPEGTPPTRVRFTLDERDGVTTVTLTHSGFTHDDGFEGHNEGWGMVLPLLGAYMERKASA